MLVNSNSASLKPVQVSANASWKSDRTRWSVVWVIQGCGLFDARLQLSPLENGTVLVVPEGMEVAFKAHSNQALRGHALFFNPAQLPCSVSAGARLQLQHAAGDTHRAALLPKGNALVPLLEALVEELTRRPAPRKRNSDDLIHVCPCPLALRLTPVMEELTQHIHRTQNTAGDAARRVMSILSSLDELALQSITLDELARRCGYSRRHLARLVREQCNTSLAEMVTGVRLEKAAQLLHDPSRKIVDVAMDCGFNHLGAFSARFRQRFGMTPAVWRRHQASQGLQVTPRLSANRA